MPKPADANTPNSQETTDSGAPESQAVSGDLQL
jgi:hypothetical protein